MLKLILLRAAVFIAAAFGFGTAAQAAICPTTANTNTDCAFIITIAADGSITGAAIAGANPYDGIEDALVGVVNNMATPFTGSITLSSGVSIFGFDGDGICAFTSDAYCATAPTGYEGPNNTFANISGFGNMGDVVFNVGGGIAGGGGTTFFSLEESPSAITGGGGIIIGGGVPEPTTWALMLVGFLAVGGMLRRRRRTLSPVSFA